MKKQPNTAPAVVALLLSLFLTPGFSYSQIALGLNDLSAFVSPANNWQIAGKAAAELNQPNVLITEKGQGVLVNVPAKNDHGSDLVTAKEFSDLDLELDYMMAKGSNSGIYLQGRYELQLTDSWAKPGAQAGDNGGIYERWDEGRGKGNEGYDGHAPRQNVSKAPGLWQHLKIAFQAPRFDGAGKKIQNARFLKVELNGVLIHEDVEVEGPTRGAIGNNEVAAGPLRLQGDHGAVAFKNITIKNYYKPRPEFTDLKFEVFSQKFEKLPDFSGLKPVMEGTSPIVSSAVTKMDNDFIIKYTGNIIVKAAGSYRFDLYTSGGVGSMKIDNKVVKDFSDDSSKAMLLQEGKFPVEIIYAKNVSWEMSTLGLTISNDDIREFLVSDPGSMVQESDDPILVEAASNSLMRSFMDIPGGKRIVHAISVGNAQQLHFTYDLDHGMLLQAWRGSFLDATPMWHDRGDGSSKPLGAKQLFGDPYFTIQKLGNDKEEWKPDSAGTSFFSKGYELDTRNNPTFVYHIYGASVNDEIHVSENGQALNRKVTVEKNPGNLFLKIASGKSIESMSKGWFLVDDRSYYIRMDDNTVPVIRTSGGMMELVAPIQSGISYSILF